MVAMMSIFAAMAMVVSLDVKAPAWPHAEDIPKVKPVRVGLAGQSKSDPARYFLASGPSAPSLSPDGRQLAFISRITGLPQVWVTGVTGGAPRQLTFGLGVDVFMWTPDGSAIVYTADRDGNERYGFYWISADGTNERQLLAPSAAFTVPGGFTADGEGFIYATTGRDPHAFDIYVAPLTGSGSKLVREGRLGFYPHTVQPGGKLLIATEVRGESTEDVVLVDIGTGGERPLFRPKDPASYDSFSWAPDGSGFYFTTDEGRDHSVLAYHRLDTGKTTIVAAPPHDVAGAALSADGRFLVWQTDENGFHRLHARDLKTKRDLPMPTIPPGVYTVTFARGAPVAAIAVEGPRTPGEIWLWEPESGDTRRAAEPNGAGLDLGQMAVPLPVSFPARDGVSLSALLYMPPVSNGRAPVFLRLHGGPSSHARPGWRPDIQYLVSRGIAVLDFNYRGSTGAGKAHTRLNDRRLRINEINDLVDAVGWIRRQPKLDSRRIAVGGSSYGGYLTNAVLGHHPDLFVAGVSEVGVADWVVNLERASPQLQASDRAEYGDIRNPDDRAFLKSLSPMNKTEKIKAPLLIRVGANDPRDGAEEQDAFVTAIRSAGGTVIYRRYADEGHGLASLANILDWNIAKADFLVQYLSLAREGAGLSSRP